VTYRPSRERVAELRAIHERDVADLSLSACWRNRCLDVVLIIDELDAERERCDLLLRRCSALEGAPLLTRTDTFLGERCDNCRCYVEVRVATAPGVFTCRTCADICGEPVRLVEFGMCLNPKPCAVHAARGVAWEAARG
jgi:hypothetical protein